jgi:hypothetical protein
MTDPAGGDDGPLGPDDICGHGLARLPTELGRPRDRCDEDGLIVVAQMIDALHAHNAFLQEKIVPLCKRGR